MARPDTLSALNLVKSRLNRLPLDTSLDEYLIQRIDASAETLKKNGIDLQDTADDLLLLVDYTVWRYQNRDTAEDMPRWLRLLRRERFLHTGGGSA